MEQLSIHEEDIYKDEDDNRPQSQAAKRYREQRQQVEKYEKMLKRLQQIIQNDTKMRHRSYDLIQTQQQATSFVLQLKQFQKQRFPSQYQQQEQQSTISSQSQDSYGFKQQNKYQSYYINPRYVGVMNDVTQIVLNRNQFQLDIESIQAFLMPNWENRRQYGRIYEDAVENFN